MTLTKTKPHKPTRADRQRVGHHHHHGNHYLKTYWPYLPMIAIVSAGFAANNWLSGLHKNVLGYATDMSASSLLSDTNLQRTSREETVLHLDTHLDGAAQAKANDMAARNYWSHITPDGKTPWSFISSSGYVYRTAGENLAYGFGTASSVITGWMNSPEHRANLLNAGFTDVGFGIANIPNFQHAGPETLVVAMYASPASDKAAVLGASSTTSSPERLPSQHIARIQLASGSAAWSVMLVGLLGLAGFAVTVPRHSLAWRKVLVHGERFVLRHPLLDIVGVSLVAASIVLSHTAGIIH